MHVYVVGVSQKYKGPNYKVSQDAYSTYDEALEFVLSRNGVERCTDYVFESQEYIYEINDLYLVEHKRPKYKWYLRYIDYRSILELYAIMTGFAFILS